jgi:hypothetical protein
MDYRPAEFVRYVEPAEALPDILDEAKAETWTKRREHALLQLEDGRLVLVRGGHDGIELISRNDGVYVEISGQTLKVSKLAWHVHPRATGPSDHDRAILQGLGQRSSVVFEINGEPGGTRFGPQKGGEDASDSQGQF